MYYLFWKTVLFLTTFVIDQALTSKNEVQLVLYEFDQSECITSCTNGLINCTDRIVMKGSVNYRDLSSDIAKTFEVEVRKKNEQAMTEFCSLSKRNCNVVTATNCYCKKVNTTYDIVINTTAETTWSEADVVLTILKKDGGSDIASREVKIPKIYRCNDVVLSLNNNEIDASIHPDSITDTQRNITFCCYNTPTPCKVSILMNQLKLNTSTRCVQHYQDTNGVIKYTFEYVVCNATRKSFPISLRASSVSICQHTSLFILYLTLISVINLLDILRY